MHTTTTPKFPIHSLLDSHNTRVPAYEFDIDLIGTGFDVFSGQILKNRVSILSEDDLAYLKNILDFQTVDGTLLNLSSVVPAWSKQAEFLDFEGLDISKPFDMSVRNNAGKLLFHDEDGRRTMTNLLATDECWDQAFDLIGTGPRLYASDVYPIHVRYPIAAKAPFDHRLVAMRCQNVCGSRLIDRFEYDSQIIEPELIIWPYDHQRFMTCKFH